VKVHFTKAKGKQLYGEEDDKYGAEIKEVTQE